jgi:putative transposase
MECKLESQDKAGRRSVRLKSHCYADPGYYFITICSHQRHCIFGQIENASFIGSAIGKILESELNQLSDSMSGVTLDEWVLMPNHLHAIFQISKFEPKQKSLAKIVGIFKGRVTASVRLALNDPDYNLWQRSFWDRVIRNEHELMNIRQYIRNNPLKWELDRLHPRNW